MIRAHADLHVHTTKSPPNKHAGAVPFLNNARTDYERVCELLSTTSFDSCYCSNNVNNQLKSTLMEAVDHFTPRLNPNKIRHSPWFTADIRHRLRCLRSMRHRYHSSLTQSLATSIHQSEIELQSIIGSAKSVYESDLHVVSSSQKGSSESKIFRHIKPLNKGASYPPVMNLNSELASSDLDKANLFNKFFFPYTGVMMICLLSFFPVKYQFSSNFIFLLRCLQAPASVT